MQADRLERTLVVLAAGLSRRYGTLKQLDPLGPNGETLLDYAVYDAARAGFTRVSCVVRPEIETDVRAHVANGLSDILPVDFVVQGLDEGGVEPRRVARRDKPWGTGHAILVASERIANPFVSVNADDFYGADSYLMLIEHLESCPNTPIPDFALVGFPLRDTLSRAGGVSRAICQCDEDRFVRSIIEVTDIVASEDRGISGVTSAGETCTLTGDEMVSMNMWGFTAAVAPLLRDEFAQFLRDADLARAEFLVGNALNAIVGRGHARLKLLVTRSPWFGVTYPGDRPAARERLRTLTDLGVYPNPLYRRRDG